VAIEDGNATCAAPYDEAVQCLVAAGCGTCTTETEFDTCEQIVLGNGGACESYAQAEQSSCAAEVADGGSLNGGPCSDDPSVLSVICGNGSGDGG